MLQLEHICKSYTTGSFTQKALDDVSVAFRDNEFVAILGPSGSGKTTLLNIVGGLDHYDSGDLIIDGISTKKYRERDWDTYRNNRIGFVFQSYNLITHQTVLSNVELALTLSGVSRAERRQRAIEALERVGLGDHIDKKPAQMSGGQMQRVAIARALVNDPDILLADEPTGALDTETGIQVMDLLAEVANDRLVIMVTHNPDLAEQYATRIVNIHDGRIEHDSMPFDPATEPAVAFAPVQTTSWDDTAARAAAIAGAAPAATAAATGWRSATNAAVSAAAEAPAAAAVAPAVSGRAHGGASSGKGTKKSRMSFLTALSLSFNNLMTKKGRTFLTAFAGSIGIIGIAAILALSNGVNAYIADTEEEALTSYPLTITKSSFDLSNLMTGMAGYASSDEEGGNASGSGSDSKQAELIPQSTIMTDMFAKVKNNDLKTFKAFLDAGGNGIGQYVNDIEYDFGIKPLVYKADTTDGLVKLNPGYMSSVFSNGLNSSALLSMGSGMSSFQEMLEDQDMMTSQMQLVQGRWPENYDEAVLVLSRRGKISDYTLYSLGVMNPKAMEEMTKQALNGEDVTVPDEHVDFTYEDAMNLHFKVVPTAATYKHNDEQNTWTDMSKDEDFMREAVANGIDMKVVGIVKNPEEGGAGLLSEGIAYPKSLTYHLMEQAAASPIVKQQLENRDVDVFTGKTFDELQDNQNKDFDLSNIFTVDENALQNAFAFDSSALSSFGSGTDLDMSGLDMSKMNIDPSTMDIDPSTMASAFDEAAMAQMIAGMPQPDLTKINPSMSAEQQAAMAQVSAQISAGFMQYLLTQGVNIAALSGEQINQYYAEYLQTETAQSLFAQLNVIIGNTYNAAIQTAMQDYMTTQFAPYLQTAMGEMMANAAQVIATQMAEAMAVQMAAATGQLGTTLAESIGSSLSSQMDQLSSALQNAFSIDTDAFANAFKFNMTQEDLTSLLTNYMNAEELTYDNNLTKLGYASTDSPNSIAIYSKDFAAKESVLKIIDGYNDEASIDGDDSDTIQYSDIAGVLMSSVTDIVNMISLVLIAFVSISLVVSSIMIGIVTYISVLERKKEIGILRSLGASRGNVANVFNAETVIEGLAAGVFAIAVVVLVSIPVNAIVMATQGVPNVMQLPWTAGLALILISVALTLIAGLLPSQKAAHADPVEALRSE